MRHLFYALRDGVAVPVTSEEYVNCIQESDNHIADTTRDDVRVSTVFLGINHRYGDGLPLVFETMIFGGPHDEYQRRYSTLEDAIAGHQEACKLVFGKTGDGQQ